MWPALYLFSKLEAWSMDLTLLQWGDAGWGDELVRGAMMTVVVAACSYFFGIIFGSLCCRKAIPFLVATPTR